MSNRRERNRADFDVGTRLRLLEGDADSCDAAFARMETKMETGFRRCEEDSDGLRKVLTGLLIAVVTTSITIVATVLVAAGRL